MQNLRKNNIEPISERDQIGQISGNIKECDEIKKRPIFDIMHVLI